MSLKYEKLIRKMTLAEKAIMMSGKNTWETVDLEKYGIPSMVMSDGPHGLRRQAGAGDHLGLNASLPATCFPTAAGVANSWDEALGEEIGEALAEEAVTMGVNVILGPGLNIKRSPLCGRNFEYFSEDPYHAGKMRRHMFVESRARVLQLVQSILQQTVRSCAAWQMIPLWMKERSVRFIQPDSRLQLRKVNQSPSCLPIMK